MQVTLRLLRPFVSVLAFLATASVNALAQDSRLVGCYEVSVGSWSGGPGFTSSSFFRIPPRVSLTTVRSALASTDRTTFLVRAAPGTAESAFEDATWSSDSAGESVLLRWFTPTFGIQARVKVTVIQGGDVIRLEGEAVQHSDHPSSAGPTATLVLQRVACFRV